MYITMVKFVIYWCLCVLYLTVYVAMVKAVTGGYKIQYHPEGPDGPSWEVDFTPPFRKIDMLKDLAEILETKLPAADQLHTKGGYRGLRTTGRCLSGQGGYTTVHICCVCHCKVTSKKVMFSTLLWVLR